MSSKANKQLVAGIKNALKSNHLTIFSVKNNPLNYTDPLGLVWYGNWCGPGGSGPEQDCVDKACEVHDKCYEKCGVDASTRWTWRNILSPCALICDLKLLNGVNGCQGEICH